MTARLALDDQPSGDYALLRLDDESYLVLGYGAAGQKSSLPPGAVVMRAALGAHPGARLNFMTYMRGRRRRRR